LFGEDDVEDAAAGISVEEARIRSEVARKAFEAPSQPPPFAKDANRGGAIPGWYEEYSNLVDGGWPWRVAAYIAWAASPRTGRWPETQAQLATDVLGLTSDRQITKWRGKNPAIADMISTLQVAPMLAHRADVVNALIKSATDPDYKSHQDRKLFLEITGDYVPTSKLLAQLKRSAGGGAGELSDDELLRYAGLEDQTPTQPPAESARAKTAPNRQNTDLGDEKP